MFHNQLDPDDAHYHNVSVYFLRGSVDMAAMTSALRAVLAHHPVLRTGFELSKYGEPVQLVHRRLEPPIASVDWSHLDDADADRTFATWYEKETRAYFDIRQPPLFRIHVHRLGSQRSAVTLTEHHAILDGWSVATMMSELMQRYAGEQTLGEAPAAPGRFRDYVRRERQAIASDDDREFWREHLRQAEPQRLPRVPFNPPEASSSRSGSLEIAIASQVAGTLRDRASALKVPLKTVLLAAHYHVLSVLVPGRSAITGLISHGRDEAWGGSDELGLFLNTLPLGVTVEGSWAHFIKAVFAAEQDAVPHRFLPLAEILRISGHTALFETTFNFTNFHVYQGLDDIPGVEIAGGQFFERTNFALCADFRLDPRDQTLHLSLDCDPGVVPNDMLAGIGVLYEVTLAAVARDVDQDVSAPLPGLHETAQPWHAKVNHGDESQASIHRGQRSPNPGTILDGLSESWRELGDRIALRCGDRTVSYSELDRISTTLAVWLRERGISREHRVGACLPRSVDSIIAQLGIFKAGAVYVPLDPDDPVQRRDMIIADAELELLLIEPSSHSIEDTSDKHLHSVPTLPVDGQWRQLQGMEWTVPLSPPQPDDGAYIIYTSGSTGKPKGVLIEHGALKNHCQAMVRHFEIGPDDRVLQMASLTFDASLEQIWPTLTRGGQLIMRDTRLWSPQRIRDEILSHRIRVAEFTPAYLLECLRQWSEEDSRALAETLRLVPLGGDRVSPEIARQWHRRGWHGIRLVNTYGPTETTITCTAHDITEDEMREPPPSVSIGSPILNVDALVMDPHGRPVPRGVPGELWIAGTAVARGYHRRPELNAQRFVQVTSIAPAQRAYRTGDMVRMDAEGQLDFLGRVDGQVKVRGYRVELGEIERCLLGHTQVSAANVAVDGSNNQARLVAQVVLRPDALTAHDNIVAELRQHLRASLPDFMVPNVLLPVATIELGTHGKVSHRIARRLATTLAERASVRSQAPATPVQGRIAAIWREVLEIPDVPVDESFFDLGGHSLLLLRVHSRLQDEFSRTIDLLELFQYPTVRELADHLSRSVGPTRSSEQYFESQSAEPRRPDQQDSASSALREQMERRRQKQAKARQRRDQRLSRRTKH
ncbi:MAG: amino acid adenylation domain-containing protein [Myxococcota bacterium]